MAMDPRMMAMMGGKCPPAIDQPPESAGGSMEAVIAALEQARAALDDVETAAMGQRKAKSALPPEAETPEEEKSPDEEQE
jgi:hypothetical protein